MPVTSMPDKRTSRLKHIEAHRAHNESYVASMLRNIEHNLGNPTACIGSLSDHALTCAMSAWFTHRDLDAMRQWCYVAARLDQELRRRSSDTMGPGGKMLQLLKPLLSNDRPLIDWFAAYDQAYDLERVEDPNTHDFWAYQAVVALRGDWNRLIERCSTVIHDPPKNKDEKTYLLDHQFYLALARGETNRMRETLRDIVGPKAIHARGNDESGYTKDLISTPAVIYAKIALLHGYWLGVDSPYIPADWLPMEPLPQYDACYSFLK